MLWWGGREEVLLPPLLPVLFNLFHKILTYSCYPESPQVTMPQPIWPLSEQSLTRGQPDSSSIALTTVLLVVLPPWLPFSVTVIVNVVLIVILIVKVSLVVIHSLREAPLRKTQGLFGHCPNSDCTPPPFTQTGTLGHFISGPTWANAIWTSIFTA